MIRESLNGIIRSHRITTFMASSASRSSEAQYFQVVQSESPASQSPGTVADASVIENILFGRVLPLFYKSRVRVAFSLSEEFKMNFGLIKGLIEFHRSRHFLFKYNFLQRTIATDIEASKLPELKTFLQDVSVWLTREIQFKKNLKTILEFENRYKLAQAEVYALIHKSE
jgi:hypothetical protein